ncbi:MAG TPA: aldehyde dehydrogenase family protein [Bacteroidales bacterium]|nr:aldehyde dehydrogenase family protein [Bacteroidales bacterium]HSA44013.1 aldehyde dehydrogenase family protein [Bacteroidales bacterium]
MEQNIDEIMLHAGMAAAEFHQFNQQQTDAIVEAVYRAAFNKRVPLATMAIEETGLGRWEDKVIKNVVASQYVYEEIMHEKTVGVISEDHLNGVTEIAQPMGPVLAIIPVTNPTSTTIFKILICLKTRNPVIICPSKKAARCSIEAARICYEAALSAGAPEGCIQWITSVSRDTTHALMAHQGLSLILATGGGGLVKAAYSSGTPSIGVGAGNVPVFIEKSADVPFAVDQIILSKTFDNGTLCASEQAIVVEKCIAEAVKSEFKKHQAYFVPEADLKKLSDTVIYAGTGLMNPEVVGQSAVKIAAMAGIAVPENTLLLIAPQQEVGAAHPLSSEILAPVLAFYEVDDFDAAMKVCIRLNFHGGIGHSVSIFSNDEAKISYFAAHMNAGRIVVNVPSSHGAVGGLFTRISTSFTLGCGTGGKNITTDNVSARHLINIQRVLKRRENQKFVRFDASAYLDESLTIDDISPMYHRNYL